MGWKKVGAHCMGWCCHVENCKAELRVNCATTLSVLGGNEVVCLFDRQRLTPVAPVFMKDKRVQLLCAHPTAPRSWTTEIWKANRDKLSIR